MPKNPNNTPAAPDRLVSITNQPAEKQSVVIDAVTQKILEQISKALEAADLEEVEKLVFKVIDKVDESAPMNKLRQYWRHVPHFVRWAIIHVPGTVPNPILQTCSTLMSCGFLPYEDDPQMNDEYHKHKDNYDQTLLKWGVKIGKYILPELAELEIALQAVYPVMTKISDYKSKIRAHLTNKHTRQLQSGGATAAIPGGSASGSSPTSRGTKYISVDTDLTEEDLPIYGRPYYSKKSAPKKE